MKREYKDLPDPVKEPEAFNQYLRDNNEVLLENDNWIVIKNSYIENQLVVWNKRNARYISELTYDFEWHYLLKDILSKYDGKHIYINADEDKSVPNRLHLHIKL